MAEVALASGVARATVFNYFPSKQAIIDAITGDVLEYWLAMLERAEADEQTSTPALLRALFGHMGDGIERVRDLHRGVFREITKLQLGLEEGGTAGRSRDLAIGRLAALMARGQGRREIRRDLDPEDLARAFDGLAIGTILHWLYGGESRGGESRADRPASLRARLARAASIFLEPVSTLPDEPLRGEPLPDLAPR